MNIFIIINLIIPKSLSNSINITIRGTGIQPILNSTFTHISYVYLQNNTLISVKNYTIEIEETEKEENEIL